ncbi:MAG: M56 family metallopeptidase [Defluviitaleaceae bacterium]|nr:M56 family metallopeptidase [Defluviitaleaceae bacterium]MCL2240326.1 M56 family metallopeptidase [Defluviitaleaceae bacterium]
MNNLMLTVLSLSLAGSIVIAFLFLCKPLYKERLSRKWQYYIWLIVIARLLIPFSFEVHFAGSLFNEIGQANVFSFLENAQGNEAPITSPDLQNLLPPVPYAQSDILSVLLSYIWLIWLVVAVILFIRKITIYQSFVNYIKAGRVPLESMADLERLGKLVEQAKIKRMVGIYTNNLVSSPLLIGFFKPYIVLPTMDISEADFKHTVIHELTHHKRGDMFYKWLVQLTICLHWFNPLVYLMGHEINNACEFSCDEAVIKNLNDDGIKEYGNTLLNALGFGGAYKNSLSSVTLSENKKILEERLHMIKNFKKKSVFTAFCAVLLFVGLAMGASFIGVYGFASPQSQSNAQPANFVVPTLSVYELHTRVERPGNAITSEVAAEIVARYIWDNFGVSIDGSVVFMNYQYTQARMRMHANDDVTVSAWSFRVGDEAMSATNMIFDFMGILNATTGEMISIFPTDSDNQITAYVPFSTGQAPALLPNENRQILLTSLQNMENSDDVFEFSYNPQTNVIWIANTGERADVPPNHVNVRCADTGEIFHIQVIDTVGGVPQLAFFVEITDAGTPRLVSIDNTTRPNIIADGNITIGLSPSDRS